MYPKDKKFNRFDLTRWVNDIKDFGYDISESASTALMKIARSAYNNNWKNFNFDNENVEQDTFLSPRKVQERAFLRKGYIKGAPGDYGLVKKAVGNRNIPIYQTKPDAISRDKLIVLGNVDNTWYGDDNSALKHPGSYPTSIYTDGVGNYYLKAWDLNDYGGDYGSTTGVLGDLLDYVGNPVVTTTGYQKMLPDRFPGVDMVLEPMMAKKGLTRTDMDGSTLWTLPEITITGKKKIKPRKNDVR